MYTMISDPLLNVIELCKRYSRAARSLSADDGDSQFTAVDGVSFRVETGETFAVVGESGCGKTTLARMLLRLIEPHSGQILFSGQNLLALSPEELRLQRRQM